MRELAALQEARQAQLKISKDESLIPIVTRVKRGKSVTEIVTKKPKVAAGVRQKAAKDAAILARQIANVEKLIAARKAESGAERERSENAKGGLFEIVVSGKSINSLIAHNTAGKVN